MFQYKFKISFLICFFISFWVHPQLEFSKEIKHSLDSLYRLSEVEPNKTIILLDSLYNTINENDEIYFSILSNYIKGCVYRNLSNFEKTTYHFEITKELAQEYNWKAIIAEVYREMGDEYIDQKLYNKAIENYDKAKVIYEELGNEEGVIICTYNGFIESLQGKHKTSNTILKGLLPTFKKAHPVYLDALSTISQNYYVLKNIDSAYAYVNKMPLESVEDINNDNYRFHKNLMSVNYFIAKKNVEQAKHFNELINKSRYSLEVDIDYFKNSIEIAKLTGDLSILEKYTDSLNIAYEKRLNEVKVAEVYTTDKFIETTKRAKKDRAFFVKNLWLLITVVITLFMVLIILYRRFIINKKKQEILVNNMRDEIRKLVDELRIKETNIREKNTQTIDAKILELANKHELTERETEVLFYIAKIKRLQMSYFYP